ncbi:uncharacterized protein LOC126742876 [Anthonomus grandis grandis]|uniref:uncharacterized protein LOC126742876 n=1 Tax=Anthonomus grandis grandis TaxID=2921223 RepID=UPI002166493E|nr:uncharacterized protein LOC126742876 [Anthonomus grandis grandis]
MSIKNRGRNILSLTQAENNKIQTQLEKLHADACNERLLDLESPPNYSVSTNSGDLEGILDLGVKLSGLSSSSSLSWSEDYESEVGKKVQSELEKLDRLFQGLDEDPSPYDLQEIHEWKQFFPYLHILGSTTPTNSSQNSNGSSETEEEATKPNQTQNLSQESILLGTQSSFVNRRRHHPTFGNPNSLRDWNTVPPKPKSLEINQYLRISSIKSPDTTNRKQVQSISKKDLLDDQSPEYISLPFITATSLHTQTKRKLQRNKPANSLVLPPIENTFRSISATPRQASSKSMFVSFNYDRSRNKVTQAAKLKSELMKLFDHIPITNR